MKGNSKTRNVSGQIEGIVILVIVVLIIVVSRNHSPREENSGTHSSSVSVLESTESEPEMASTSSEEAERSRLREEIRKRIEAVSEKSQTSADVVSYPEDPYHVFEYDDPYAFWWDWGDEFDNYDDCYEYWDWAWGNLK